MPRQKLSLDTIEIETFATTPAMETEAVATGLLNSCNTMCITRVDSTCPCCD
ncbi:MAG TPA: hypothetical protein VHG91_19430 [Longimicrobium sp.]|nr:hypothetical protein [Longimicrobium sp.]